MKKLALLLMFAPLCVYAQTGVVQNHCYLGGKPATTSGANSSNYLDGIIPACSVTVYLTGTTTKQTITKPDGSPLANPFFANTATAVDPGGWIFRAATNVGLDVVMSGGNSNPNCTTAPLCYTQPVTLVDIFPSQSFNPVGGVTSLSSVAPIKVNAGTGPVTGGVTVTCDNATNSSLGCAQADGTTITASGGILSAQSVSSGLKTQVVPPVAGQSVVIYPTSSLTSNCGSGTIGSDNTSGFIDFVYGGSGACNATITWTFGPLPAYVLPANVTAVYGFTVASTQPLVTGNIASTSVVCSPGSTTVVTSNGIIPINQYNALTGITGAQINGATCVAQAGGSVIGSKTVNFDIKAVGLIVYYTGSAPPANSNVLVAPPLYFNPSTLTLGITVPYDIGLDTGAANSLTANVAGYELTFGQRVTIAANHATTSTTPTFNLNGLGALTIVGAQGAALVSGDINTTVPAVLMYGTNGSTGLWYLQNPQVSSGGGGTTTNALTANNTGGAAPGDTFNGSAAKTWDYHTFGAPGISGTPTTGNCVDWASANTIGDAGAPCGSGSGSGTVSGQAAGVIPLGTSATVIGNQSHLDDGVTAAGKITSSEPLVAPSVATGTPSAGVLSALPTGAHGFACDESVTAGVPALGVDYIRCDGTTHQLVVSQNNGAETPLLSGTGLSGMTAGQVGIAGSASTITSSKALAGAGAGITTGPTSSTSGDIATFTGTAGQLQDGGTFASNIPSQYKTWSCQPGLGDGLNAIAAGTYLESTCMNTTGVTVTLTGLKCFTDNAGTSTMNAAGNTLGALLTGAVTCSTSFAAGTQSANVALTNGDYIKFTFVADGTSKQTTFVVTGTY